MDVAILVSLGILITLVVTLLLRGRASDGSLRQIEETRNVISDHALKTVQEIRGLGETVFKLAKQQEQAEKLGQSLKDLLQAPKLRGSYGEAILEELLDRVLPAGVWERQFAVDGREMVDCVVKFKEVVIPIDAKFPRDNYMKYLEAESNEERSVRWKEFESSIKEKIISIESKYVKPEKGTSEFALMFIPSEAVYYETIAEKNQQGEFSTIFTFAQDHHVFPVSPNTLYAFLQIVVLGIRNVEIIRNAKKLQQGLSSLQRSFEMFYRKHVEMGKGLDRATEAYRVGSGHIDRYKKNLTSTLQLEGLQDEIAALPGEAVEEE
ncbi:MAG: hypothetical protein BZY82_01570 [SAR202 cluster bacterium Io17-Chloro-G3]|nr:MAG: hypothetical protein BZY82_01570 [SAR202 cluster bacterium Io17-Chloro-G3]